MATVRLLVVLSAAALAPAAALGVAKTFRTEVVKHRGSCYETNIQDAPNRNQASESAPPPPPLVCIPPVGVGIDKG